MKTRIAVSESRFSSIQEQHQQKNSTSTNRNATFETGKYARKYTYRLHRSTYIQIHFFKKKITIALFPHSRTEISFVSFQSSTVSVSPTRRYMTTFFTPLLPFPLIIRIRRTGCVEGCNRMNRLVQKRTMWKIFTTRGPLHIVAAFVSPILSLCATRTSSHFVF